MKDKAYPFGRLEESAHKSAALKGRMSCYSLQESVEPTGKLSSCIGQNVGGSYSSLRRSMNSGLNRSPVIYSAGQVWASPLHL